MVLKDYIRSIVGISALILMAFMFSCEELSTLTVNCIECLADDPTDVTIVMKIDTRYGGVRINIYEGKLENNVLYDSFLTHSEESVRLVPANRSYTVSATYKMADGNFIVAVDDLAPHVKYDKSSCDNPCYYVYNNRVNLKLKYIK